jgi:hypothetical protein
MILLRKKNIIQKELKENKVTWLNHFLHSSTYYTYTSFLLYITCCDVFKESICNFCHYYELSHNCCVTSKVHYEGSILNIAMIFMPCVSIIEFIVYVSPIPSFTHIS